MAWFGVTAGVGAIVKVASGTKRAIDFLQQYNGLEEEGYILWKTLEALSVPTRLVDQVSSTHARHGVSWK